MKIGLFFGSFNPIHNGHLVIASTMINESNLDKVWFVVSPQNPFKNTKSLLHEFDRLDMVRAAVEGDDRFVASDIEFSMPKPSYTIDTLTYLKEKYPSYEFVLIMGEDNLTHFHKWKNHEQILEHFEIYTYPRPRNVETPFHTHEKVTITNAALMDISSTYIRKCIVSDKSINYLVPEKVKELIESRGLYH